eukprot:CAMPEP_0197911104 /NCGR_PEP_ID=MMETSP1439-20131203/72195_1 /TAXON_ID=66791 /ORGANISM="Gonyaulax spinifera, Strain CCMP409" /LENGTH=146 /DNA_ID=CAMNT_0043532815 /DNA_START=93 /DNA_END=534 /DNA_ORIENTATION=+
MKGPSNEEEETFLRFDLVLEAGSRPRGRWSWAARSAGLVAVLLGLISCMALVLFSAAPHVSTAKMSTAKDTIGLSWGGAAAAKGAAILAISASTVETLRSSGSARTSARSPAVLGAYAAAVRARKVVPRFRSASAQQAAHPFPPLK